MIDLQALAVVDAGDAARDAAAAVGVRHQHAIAAGQRQIGGEGGALVAALFLGHLHQQDLPALDDFLDLVAAQVALPAAAGLLLVDLGVVLLRRLFAADHVDDFGRGLNLDQLGLGRRGQFGIAVAAFGRRFGRHDIRSAGGQGLAVMSGIDAAGRRGGRGRGDVIDRRAAQFEARGFERGAAGVPLGLLPGRNQLVGGARRQGRGVALRLAWAFDRSDRRAGLGSGLFAVRDRGRTRLAGMLPDVVRSAIVARRDRGAGVGRAFLERCLGRAALARPWRRHRRRHDRRTAQAPAARRHRRRHRRRRGFAQQPFAVGDRDAVIVGVDFAEGQEAVAIAAIFDERRLQRRFDAGYLREIDVSFERASAGDLDVKFFQLPSVRHRDPGFFRVGGVDQHDLCHSG